MAGQTRITDIRNAKTASKRMQSVNSAYNSNAYPQTARRNVHYRNEAVQQQNIQQPETGKKVRYYYDFSLLFAVIFLFAVGLLVIYSASQYTAAMDEKINDARYYFNRQLFIGGVGLAGAIFMSAFDYKWLAKANGLLCKLAYWGSVGLLVLTLLMGAASHGKTRWLGIAGVSFQPAEVAKIGLIVMLAYFISVHGPAVKSRKNLVAAIGFAVIPTLLIITQNISSAAIVAMIAAVMIFVAIDDVKTFVILGSAGLVCFIASKPAIQFILRQTGYTTRPEKYYLRRILGWAAPDIFPDDAYQTIQSLYAIGSGGIRGHGLGESIQKFGKIPEIQNDMIFSVVCEEFGFIGAATLIIIFIYIIYRIYQIAVNARDLFGTMICAGVMAHLGIQVVLNIAVVTGVFPNTGVTLPFISYGGSAILFTMAEIGLVLSVAHRIQLGER